MNRMIDQRLKVLCLLVTGFLASCGGGRPATNSGNPPVTGYTPARISSSEDVVKVRTDEVAVPAGGESEAKVILTISPGFHVNANPATFSYLIATTVANGKMEGINVTAPVYPAAVKKKFQFAEQLLAVYEGEAPIKLNLRAEKTAAKGPGALPITIRVQACDEEQCYPPATINSKISFTVK
jgi:hypothetical protein